jgi:hypothetical protein
MSPQRVPKTTYNQIPRVWKINVHIYLDEYNRICVLEEGLISSIIFEVFGTVGLELAVSDIMRPGTQSNMFSETLAHMYQTARCRDPKDLRQLCHFTFLSNL